MLMVELIILARAAQSFANQVAIHAECQLTKVILHAAESVAKTVIHAQIV
jgi:hypothetical protein